MLSPLWWSVSHTFGVCCSTSPVRADGDLTLCPGQVAKLRILICQQSGFVQVCAFLARILRNLRTAPVPAFSSPADSSVLGQPVAQQRCPQQDSVQAKPRDSLETGTPGRSAMVMTEVTRRLACRLLGFDLRRRWLDSWLWFLGLGPCLLARLSDLWFPGWLPYRRFLGLLGFCALSCLELEGVYKKLWFKRVHPSKSWATEAKW